MEVAYKYIDSGTPDILNETFPELNRNDEKTLYSAKANFCSRGTLSLQRLLNVFFVQKSLSHVLKKYIYNSYLACDKPQRTKKIVICFACEKRFPPDSKIFFNESFIKVLTVSVNNSYLKQLMVSCSRGYFTRRKKLTVIRPSTSFTFEIKVNQFKIKYSSSNYYAH